MNFIDLFYKLNTTYLLISKGITAMALLKSNYIINVFQYLSIDNVLNEGCHKAGLRGYV